MTGNQERELVKKIEFVKKSVPFIQEAEKY
jgi:hypothetical protein